MEKTKNYLLFGAIAALTFLCVVLLTDRIKSREDMALSRAIDTVNTGTGPNTGTGATLLQFAQTFNDLANLVDTLQIDTLNADNVSALIGVNGNENYSTENYGATGTGNIVLSTGPTLTTVNITDVIKLTPTASPPAGATEGMIYADTDHHIYYFDGTSWKQLDN